MTDKQIIIEDCPYFIGGNCQEYLDGVCENHKCDLKIIRELEQKLKAKEQECEELKKQVDITQMFLDACNNSCEYYKQTLTEIKEIAEGMHDLWINKTPYTDVNNLVVHLLECELKRIRYKFDAISEAEDGQI